MPTRLTLRLAEILITAILAIALADAWYAERRDRAQLAAELATARQALTQADARQHDRDAQLLQTLSAIAAEKRTITTPAQILRDLPQQIGLPSPLVLQPPQAAESAPANAADKTEPKRQSPATEGKSGQPAKPQTQSQPQVLIPSDDLKPLYDFTLDCKACQAKLGTAQADLADEKTKTATLTEERDAALRSAKGGTILQRVARAAKWFAIGAAAGALAARAAH
jgi:hypothetical protein